MKTGRQTAKYILWDAFAALVAWAMFFFYRKLSIEHNRFDDVNLVFQDRNFWWGIVLLPIAWCCFYAILGTYKNVFRKARLKELQMTFWASLIGVIVIFFALLLDDNIYSYRTYYVSFLMLFVLHFALTYIGRLCITSRTARLIHTRKIGFPTLLVGSGEKAYNTYLDLDSQAVYSGNLFVGFIKVNGYTDERLAQAMPYLGDTEAINSLIEKYNIEEVIFAIDDHDDTKITQIIRLLDSRDDVILKITPNMRDIVYGSVKLNSIFHSPLITINPQ